MAEIIKNGPLSEKVLLQVKQQAHQEIIIYQNSTQLQEFTKLKVLTQTNVLMFPRLQKIKDLQLFNMIVMVVVIKLGLFLTTEIN